MRCALTSHRVIESRHRHNPHPGILPSAERAQQLHTLGAWLCSTFLHSHFGSLTTTSTLPTTMPQQYAPPSGPPPAYQPLSGQGAQQPGGYPPPTSAPPGGYPPPNAAPGSWNASTQQAPYPPQSSYPPPSGPPPPQQQQQQGQYAPLRQGTVGSYGAPPAGGSNNPFADAAASSAPLGRQDSIQAHARRMSNDLAKQQAGRAGSIKENPLDLLKTFDTIFIVDDSS